MQRLCAVVELAEAARPGAARAIGSASSRRRTVFTAAQPISLDARFAGWHGPAHVCYVQRVTSRLRALALTSLIFLAGQTWTFGELPGLTYNVGGAPLDRASDAVVAFGPNNTVYYNSLVFDDSTLQGLCSSMAINVSHDGGKTWSAPAFVQLGTND